MINEYKTSSLSFCPPCSIHSYNSDFNNINLFVTPSNNNHEVF